MSYDVIALVVGTILAVGALAFVMHPLFFEAADPRVAPAATDDRARDDSAIVALREIEFDRATGKLSDSDYAELRGVWGQRAIEELRAAAPDAPAPAPATPRMDDLIEARVRAYREARPSCGQCGLRPEPDAVYCSSCGGYLAGACPDCGASVAEPAAGFCSSCGQTLARSLVGAR